MKNNKVEFKDLGLISYKECWEKQELLHKSIVDIKLQNRQQERQLLTPNYLLFCEHPHVYTLGKSGKMDHLLLNNEELSDRKIEFFKINRGGDITYHGPGQVVGYPIIDLNNYYTDLGKYLRTLEEVIIQTIAYYGIKGYRIDKATGVWVGEPARPRKICAMGIRASRWVTMHGWALNANADLGFFKNIIPCGIEDKGVTSISNETGKAIDIEELKSILLNKFLELFKFEL